MKIRLILPLFVFLGFLIVGLLLLSLTGCVTSSNTTPSTSGSSITAPTTTISAVDLGLIQTASVVATGAVLQFLETTPSSRTDLANQIYASASALYSLSTGSVPTASQINATILSFAGSNPAAAYTQYASALSGVYSSWLGKTGTNGANAVAILRALAAGAQAAASAYTSTPAPQ